MLLPQGHRSDIGIARTRTIFTGAPFLYYLSHSYLSTLKNAGITFSIAATTAWASASSSLPVRSSTMKLFSTANALNFELWIALLKIAIRRLVSKRNRSRQCKGALANPRPATSDLLPQLHPHRLEFGVLLVGVGRLVAAGEA